MKRSPYPCTTRFSTPLTLLRPPRSDGSLDLLIANENKENELFKNDGDGTFTAVSLSTEAADTTSIAFGDYDGCVLSRLKPQ